MIPQLALVPPTDKLTFSLTEERTVTNDTVRIVVAVHAQKTPGMTEETLRSEMREAVRSFVDAPDWQLSQARRQTQPTGIETLAMTASVRVPETENHGLKERAEQVSRPGLTLTNPVADTTIPNAVLQAAQSELRRVLLRRAKEEAVALGTETAPLVVHTVAFGNLAAERERSAPAVVTRGQAPPGAALPGDDDVTANVTRVSMTAAVTLRRAAD